MFPHRSQLVLCRTNLDHCPIMLGRCRSSGGSLPFKFEEMWLLELEFLEVVTQEWNRVEFLGNLSRRFALKLKSLKCRLKIWNRNSATSLKTDLENYKNRIRVLDQLEESWQLSPMERSEREDIRRDFSKTAVGGGFLEAKVLG